MDKIGAHVISGTSLALGKPRLIKLVDVSPEYVRDVRQKVGPLCLIIVRFVTQNQNLDQPITAARMWFATRVGAMAKMNDPNVAFEGYNEIADSNALSYSLFEIERLRMMRVAGYRSVVGNWSAGVPKETVWPVYKPMLAAMGPGDLVGMHCYWSDRADIANPWHTARWTLPDVKPYLVGKQIVVTECGRDVVEMGKDANGNTIYKGKPGWQLTCGPDEFLGDLEEDNRLMETFPNVVGGVVYQVGSIDDEWKPFAADPVWPRVVAAYSVPQTYPAVTPPPVIPPVEVPMFPYIGKTFFPTGFEAYLKGVKPFAGLKWVVVHHTALVDAENDEEVWAAYTQERWAKYLAEYYYDKGWVAMPHLFVSDRGILVENPLNLYGRGVTGHNQDSIHVETVGNFMHKVPAGPTLDNLVAACAALLKWTGLGIGGLTNHRTLQAAFTQCPGDAFLAVWGPFQKKVSDILTPPPPVHEGLPEDETATDPATISQKCRWWAEEMQRQWEGGNTAYAQRIRLSLIQLLYRLENVLKE